MVNARLAGELEARLNEYCERTGSSRSEVMREALAKHLKANTRSTRPNLHSLAADFDSGGRITGKTNLRYQAHHGQ